jgi:hypothetical protein
MSQDAQAIIQNWDEDQRTVANDTIKQYGNPDEATPSLLIWYNKGRWTKILVSKEGAQHNFPFPHLDITESVTKYRVLTDKFNDLAVFDGSVTVRRTQGEISARCHDEMANLLAINLSHNIIIGKKTVEESRKEYVDTMVDYRANKPTPYMDALQFPEQKDTGDPDVELITPEELTKRAGVAKLRNGI